MSSFIDKSQPRERETENDDQPAERTGRELVPVAVDTDLMDRVRERMAANGYSQSEVERQIAVGSGRLSKWFGKKPEGDWQGLEDRLRRWDLDFDKRVDLRRETTPTAVTRWMGKVISSIWHTGDFGVIHGAAGIGKTSGMDLFVAETQMAAMLTARERHGGSEAMISDLWRADHIERRANERGMKPGDILISRWKKTARPLLIDQAHRMTPSGLRWVCDFHEATKCAVVLVGNPLVLEKIRAMPDEDQYTSRVGQKRDAGTIFKDEAVKELAELMLKQYAPEYTRELMEPATKVCAQKGHARRLKKQLRLMLELLERGLDEGLDSEQRGLLESMRKKASDAQIAFQLAESQLLKPLP